jgi:hypothetical protein
MELSDMEQLWKEHDIKLEKMMVLNGEMLKKLNFYPAVNEFNKLLNLSIVGRNMALIYALISGALSVAVLTDYELLIATLTGAVFMLLSFLYHLSPTVKLKKLDFYTMPVIELQKTINEFKVRSIKAGKYDFAIVLIWLLSLMPVVAKLQLHKNIYIYTPNTPYYLLIGLVVVLVLLLLNNKMYNSLYGKKLSQAEQRLTEIIVFEESRA